MRPLSSNFEVGPWDVLCAKGECCLFQFRSLSSGQCVELRDRSSPIFAPCVPAIPGKEAKKHPGNLWFRSLIESHLEEYSECTTKLEKSFVVSKIIKTVRNKSENGGFIRKVDGIWYDVGDRNAREKIGQHFRDLLHSRYRSSTKSKASIRRKIVGSTSPEAVPSSPQPSTSEQSMCMKRCISSVSVEPLGNKPKMATRASLVADASMKMNTSMVADNDPLPIAHPFLQLDFDSSVNSARPIEHNFFSDVMDEFYDPYFTASNLPNAVTSAPNANEVSSSTAGTRSSTFSYPNTNFQTQVPTYQPQQLCVPAAAPAVLPLQTVPSNNMDAMLQQLMARDDAQTRSENLRDLLLRCNVQIMQQPQQQPPSPQHPQQRQQQYPPPQS